MRTKQWKWKRIVGVAVVAIVVGAVMWGVLASLTVVSIHSSKAPSGVTTAEVTESVQNLARERALHVGTVRCRQASTNVWRCKVRLADGREVPAHGTWNPGKKVLGVGLDSLE